MRVRGARRTLKQHADQHHAQRRYEKQKSGCVGYETGQEQEGRGEQKANAINNFSQRGLFPPYLFLGPLQHGETLTPEQHCADGGSQQGQADRCPATDDPADFGEDVDFDDGDADQNEKD